MDKRYQVFISSTFTNLQEERAKVQQVVMELECIPAGMEAFPAIDEEQFEFIKKVIDDCDYYLLIIGGRYGSVFETVGLSYTEMEYDYAVSKGIKVIVFLHKDPDSLPLKKSEQLEESKQKLIAFRQKASKGRLVKFWNNADELPGLVSTSLSKTIRTYPAVGWVRASLVPDSSLYKELNDLRKENDKLKLQIKQSESLEEDYNIAGFNDELVIEGRTTVYHLGIDKSWETKTTWGDIFYMIAPGIQVESTEDSIYKYLSTFFYKQATGEDNQNGAGITQPRVRTIRIQFRALDLIEVFAKSNIVLWRLTLKGERLMLINQAKRKPTIIE
jgi:hypothetical protein